MTEPLYNPDLMPEREIKETFVARQGLVDELLSLIRSQPAGAGVQHVVLIAPRGMGKTTMLLMLGFALKDQGLSPPWQPVRFPEESYGVTDLADFWLEVLDRLAHDTQDDDLSARIASLKVQYPESEHLQGAAHALIKDWCHKEGRRLVLLVDNFDLILSQFGDEQQNAALRQALMNDGSVMVLGGATSFFQEARAYEQPLYNFFKKYDLPELKFEDMQALLRRRAAVDGRADFEATLEANASRLRVLEYFTGGNPRLVLMLYRVITQTDVRDVRQGLETLLDQVTPYYKAKTESLPSQQRKILDHIARVSSQTHEGVTPKEIGAAIRLTPQIVSAQLKRLTESGYVRPANLRGRSSYYALSEPLYAIWYQMRFGRDARQKMQWLVNFLKGWYDSKELREEDHRLGMRFIDSLRMGATREAHDILEHRRYLLEAMEFGPGRIDSMNTYVADYLQIAQPAMIKEEVMPYVTLQNLTPQNLDGLLIAGCITEDERVQALDPINRLKTEADISEAIDQGLNAMKSDELHKALEYLDRAIQIDANNFVARLIRGMIYYNLRQFDEALKDYDYAVNIDPSQDDVWRLRGVALTGLNQEEAILSFDHAIELNPQDDASWFQRGFALARLSRYEEAISSYDQALKINPNNARVWFYRGGMLGDLGRFDEAIENLDRTLQIEPSHINAWLRKGAAAFELGRYGDAIDTCQRILELDAENIKAMHRWAAALTRLGEHEQAVDTLRHAVKLEPKDYKPWLLLGTNLADVGQYQEALDSLSHAIELSLNDGVEVDITIGIQLIKFRMEAKSMDLNSARKDWSDIISIGRSSFAWWEDAANSLFFVAMVGHTDFVHDLITTSHMERVFLPLFRALDYLKTNDEALIEKLSPEVRQITREIVEKLRTPKEQQQDTVALVQ